MDAEGTWLNFGGKCGFYVSDAFYASDATVRNAFPEGEVAHEWTERIIWHYFDVNTGPIPKASSFESVYEQLSRCYRSISEVCRCVDDLVSVGGDKLTPVIFELEWPEVLLYLGLKTSHPSLRVERGSVPRGLQVKRNSDSVRDHPEIPFGVPEEEWHDVFRKWHKVFRICPSSVARATSYALEALRRMVHAVDATAVTPEAPRFSSRSITGYDDEVKHAAKEDFHPSVDFLEPLCRRIDPASCLDSDSSIPIQDRLKAYLQSLWMLFQGLMPTDVVFDDKGENLVDVSTDARSPAWERARHWLLAARLPELCDDFTDRTERQRDAITWLWERVERWPGNKLDADDFIDSGIEDYVDYLKSLSAQLKQQFPVTTATQTPHGAVAGGDDDIRQPPAASRDTPRLPSQEPLEQQDEPKEMGRGRDRPLGDPGMASVDDFLRALDSIEAEIKETSDVVFVEMSLTRGRMTGGKGDTFDENGRYIMLLTSRSIHAHWESLCFDIGGPGFPFVWSPKRSAVYESFPQDLVNESETAEFAVWYYLDSWRSPIPQHLLDMLQPRDELDRSGLAAMAYQAELDRVFNVMRSVKTAWSLAPEAVICEFGDLSRLPTGPVLPVGEGDDFALSWPAALLTLAIREVDVVLTADASSYTPHSWWASLDLAAMDPAAVWEAHDAFEPTTWTVTLSPPSLMAATSCALRAFRRVAEAASRETRSTPSDLSVDARKRFAELAKFKWTPPLLEGYVLALLKEKEGEYPTEREAAEWIATKSRKPKPSRTTLRKTWAWQNRPKKTPIPRTTNEAQSGVSPAQNADAAVSHEEITDAVLDIEEKIHRQLVEDERAAVAWTLQEVGAGKKARDEAIAELIQGFRSGDM